MHRGLVVAADPGAGQIEGHVEVALDRGHPLAETRLVRVLGEVGLEAPGLHPGDRLQDRLQRAVLVDEVHGRLLADTGDARDVVAGVPLQGLVVDDERRVEAETRTHRVDVVEDGVTDPAAVDEHAHVGIDQLKGVDVAGDDDHVQARRHRLDGERADHVVGLEGGDLDLRDAEHGDDVTRPLDLGAEVGGHGRALGLVLGHLLMAEGRARRVKGRDRVPRPVLGERLEQHRGEAVGGVGQLTPAVGERRHREEGAVDERVPVDEQQGGPLRSSVVGGHGPDGIRLLTLPGRRSGGGAMIEPWRS